MTKSRSTTKKGPGRMVFNKTQGKKRLETRTTGGNWKGKEYQSYADYDAETRELGYVRP